MTANNYVHQVQALRLQQIPDEAEVKQLNDTVEKFVNKKKPFKRVCAIGCTCINKQTRKSVPINCAIRTAAIT